MTHDDHVDCDNQLNEAEDRILQLQAELDKHRWIPVEERLPESEGYYLAAEDGRFGEYWYSKLGGWQHGDRKTSYSCADCITHWKPIILPEGE